MGVTKDNTLKYIYLLNRINSGSFDITQLSKIFGFQHTLKTLKYWESQGWISSVKKGRVRVIKITFKGKEAQKVLNEHSSIVKVLLCIV